MRHTKWLRVAACALSCTLLLVGCSAPAAPAPAGQAVTAAVGTGAPQAGQESGSANPLAGTGWQLDSLFGPAEPTPVVPGSNPTLSFGPDRYLGFGGCNWFQGLYILKGTTISINAPAFTRFGCTANTPTSVQESTFVSMFQNIAKYEIKDSKLMLYMGDDRLLMTLVPLEPVTFEGTTWELNFYYATDTAMWAPPLTGTKITAQFDGQKVSGYAGCNDYSGQYQRSADGQLTFTALSTTKKTCSVPADVMQQESAYLSMLGTVGLIQQFPRAIQLSSSSDAPLLMYQAK
jgi:heat shock protein HslJ